MRERRKRRFVVRDTIVRQIEVKRVGWITLVMITLAACSQVQLSGSVISTDSEYGNLNSDIAWETMEAAGFVLGDRFAFDCGGDSFTGTFVADYADVDSGAWIALINDDDNFQIAVSFGDANSAAQCGEGDPLQVWRINSG